MAWNEGYISKLKAVFASLIFFVLVTVSYLKFGPVTGTQDVLASVDVSELQNISECGCTRKFFYKPPPIHDRNRLNSTCSDEGSFYQTNQSVVSISLTVKDPNDTERISLYKEGLTENLKRLKVYYPESTLRLYNDMDLKSGSDYCQLLCAHPELHWCDVRKTPSLGDQSDMFLMTWRFLPLGDPTVDYFLSRDVDSVLIDRQVGAVREWLQTNYSFHNMRDHPDHNAAMLGGLWGARNSLVGNVGMATAESLRRKIIESAKKPPKSKGQDQYIINRLIFYPKGSEMVTFDSYFCKQWTQTATRPFPVKRKDNTSDFAGNWNLGRAKYELQKCPEECRPEYGKDWEYC